MPRITLKSIANDEEPETVTLVDRPEVNKKVTRVCGPFTWRQRSRRPGRWTTCRPRRTGRPVPRPLATVRASTRTPASTSTA